MCYQILFLLSLLFPVIKTSFSVKPLCLNDESYALLQFKNNFFIDENKKVSSEPLAYPKMKSWKRNKDCCSWDGVACDENTGHVISLDLSSSFLYGSMKSNSSLFRLVHLQNLNLGDNDFNYSGIPSQIFHFSELRYLNLSHSKFYGEISLEVSKLSNLVSLDLSFNPDTSNSGGLNLENSNLRRLVENLTNIEVLQLSYVKIPSIVPDLLGNITSLKSLVLEGCGLFGMFPIKIFHLPNLQFLNIGNNHELSGYFPEFQKNSSLKTLSVSNTNFSGVLPESIGNLNSLIELNFESNKLSGSLPSSLGNLTKLEYFSVYNNIFSGRIPLSLENLRELKNVFIGLNNFNHGSLDWLGSLNKLVNLNFLESNLIGNIPSSFRNLTQLQSLNLGNNQLNGPIPVWLSNLTQLTLLSLGFNQIHGSIPKSLSQLVNLQFLILNDNNLNGTMKLDMFSNMEKLSMLDISNNSLSLDAKVSVNITLPMFESLGLGGCNLNEFPTFLKYQDSLEILELEGNNIHGVIPEWVWNASRNVLRHIVFGNNALTGFVPSSGISQLKNLQTLELGSNEMRGPILIPSSSIVVYDLANNMLSGSISPLICKMHSLEIFDLSNNNLSGTIPECLGNFSNSLQFLNLEKNSLHGSIPDMFPAGNTLKVIDLSQNQLNGSLPRSLVNCTMLEVLDLTSNQILDEFPLYLGRLSNLQVLDLRSNKFYGAIKSPPTDFDFPMLRIIDVSNNAFEGNLPYNYFKIWNNMKTSREDQLTYILIFVEIRLSKGVAVTNYYYSMVLTKAGVDLDYSEVPKTIAVIDLSSNRFSGEIPESLGSLKILHLLNLSNNALTGHIPSSLGNITELESLDLSLNNLTGQIPPELVQLTFLEFLNVSNNHLTGPIPQGTQLGTFPNSSFEKNWGLCGKPLSKLCGNDVNPSSPNSNHEEEDEESSSLFHLDWIVISMGFISGIVVGVVMGQFFFAWKYDWFVKVSGTRLPARRRRLNRN